MSEMEQGKGISLRTAFGFGILSHMLALKRETHALFACNC